MDRESPSNTPPLLQPPRTGAHTIPLLPPPTPIVAAFVDLPAVSDAYAQAFGRFLALNKRMHEQMQQQQKFSIRCNRVANTIELPISIAWNLAKRVQLPDTGDATFFNAERTALRQIETAAAKQVYDLLDAARTRYITSLKTRADPEAFVKEEAQLHRDFAEKYFAVMSASYPALAAPAAAASAAPAAGAAAASSTPLIDEATQHFSQYLRGRVTCEVAAIALRDQQAKELAAQQHAENEAAREEVMQGAHNSLTITQIATSVANKVFGEKAQQLAQQPSATSGSKGRSAGKHPRDQSRDAPTAAGAESDSTRLGTPAQKKQRSHAKQPQPPKPHQAAAQRSFQLHPAFFTDRSNAPPFPSGGGPHNTLDKAALKKKNK